MIKVKLKPIIGHGIRHWIVPYTYPSWCSSCPPNKDTLTIESENKPTKEEINKELNKLGYEIED